MASSKNGSSDTKPKKMGAFRTMMTAFRNPSARPETSQASPESDEKARASLAVANVTIHQAAREGNVRLMECLMERISQVNLRKKRLNQRDESKLAPIHYAARYNHRHMIEYLIKNGANVQVKAEDDITSLHFLAKYKQKILLPGNSVEEDSSCSEGEDHEPHDEHTSSVDLLVQGGAHVNAKDASGQTPLHLACARGNTRVVKHLLDCSGLALEVVDHQGMTALHIACFYGHRGIVRLLTDAGSNLRCRDKDMTSPMHLACAEGSIQIAEILFNKARDKQLSSDLSGSRMSLSNGSNVRKASIAAGRGMKTSPRTSVPLLTPLQTMTPTKSVQGRDVNDAATQAISFLRSNAGNSRYDLVHNVMHKEHVGKKNAKLDLLRKIGLDEGVSLLLDLDSEKNLPLHLAVENGHLHLVQFCIEKTKAADLGSMVTTLRSGNDSCLHLAIQSKSLDIVKILLEEGADINARNSSLVSPLYLACQHNAHVIVKHLLESGCDIETKDTDYMTPFLVASRYGHLETLTWLMEHNADVTATDKDDKTCLMWAAEEDRADAIRLLMKNSQVSMSLEEREKYNNTALHLAAMKGHPAAVKLLLNYKASTETKNDMDRNTLHIAALYGHHSIIPDLVNRDKSIINAGDEESNTVMHLAAIGGNNKCVVTLIQLGANIELRNAKQWTALDCACAFGFVKPARALLEAGAAIEPSGKIKISPLHLACQRGHVEVVNLLLEWKADVTFRSIDGRNALDYAIDFGQKDCVLSLIKHESWQESLRNSVVHPVTGQLVTPMRKLIMKMEDMAEVVCNQCIEDNGNKPDDDNFAITLMYELFDDMYSSTEWVANPDTGKQNLLDADIGYAVFDEHGQLTDEAHPYNHNSDILQNNHPLRLMVKSKCESLLKHPIVTGLLNYKWRQFGRYVYYTSLIFFLAYLVLLNVYMLHTPLFYQVDWLTMIGIRKNETVNFSVPALEPLRCIYYRSEITSEWVHQKTAGCNYADNMVKHLRWTILFFSVFNLFREVIQFLSRRLSYISFTNFLTVTLYLCTLLMTLNFYDYSLERLGELTNRPPNNSDLVYLRGLQEQTDIRQQWQQEIGAFSVFLSWMVLLLFIRRIPKLGIFVVMFTDVLKTFAQFFLVLVFFILGFALAFSILFGNQYVFHDWYWAVVTTGVMMVGEINYSTTFFTSAGKKPGSDYFTTVYSKNVSVLVFLIFLVVMTIIIMNLLVGLAVGDIIQVQENASLERLGMQVDLTLEVEFALPEFLRKKVFLRKQTIEINKYRKANFFKRFFLSESSGMELERIQKNVEVEAADADDDLSDMDRLLSGMNALRNRVGDLLSEVADARVDIQDVNAKVVEVQYEAKEHAQDIKGNVQSTSNVLSDRIHRTHTNQLETTQLESTQTRGEVDDTRTVVANLMKKVETSREETRVIIFEMEGRLESLQETIARRHWEEFEKRLTTYHDLVEKNRQAVMEDLDNIKFVLTQRQNVTKV